MSFTRHLVTAITAGTLAIGALSVTSRSSADNNAVDRALVGVGGAGAFIPAGQVNGAFVSGGPLAGIGGAGAFIPSTVHETEG